MRWRLGVKPGRRQPVGELIYDIGQTQVADTGLPPKQINLWVPACASIVLFIFSVNLLAGQILILTMIGLMFIVHSWPWRAFGLPAAFIFYIFEVVIVVTIQAFIFAALSAIYIGSAIEPEH